MLSVQELQSGYGESVVLRDVDLEVRPGQIVCLMGRNGVGKTTLMKSIMGLLRAKKGRIRFEERDITSQPPEKRARAGIGYVPQGRDIFPQLTVEENLLLGLEAAGSEAVRRSGKVPESVFATFPALRSMLRRKGGDLSGGQQQQLAIARAMAAEPKLLLLDEPMEGIQPSIVMEIENAIASIKQAGQTAVLLVEQSLEFAFSIADAYYVMDKGTIVAKGDAEELTGEQVRRHLTV
jgi:urea transport system ATP-binding protein